MGKLRNAALILGEGPTEFYYFKSLCDVFKGLTIKPDYPKHTNIKELELLINMLLVERKEGWLQECAHSCDMARTLWCCARIQD